MKKVALYGAAGHTGRFIAAELVRRGFEPILSGRDEVKLVALGEQYGVETRIAEAADANALDFLLRDADAVINAAGPFADTAPHLIEAALRARIPYLDVTAEPFVAQGLFDDYTQRAELAGVIVAPAFAFFGAVGDLLVTAASEGLETVDHVELAFALDQWQPTKGTILAGKRRAGRRLVRVGGRFEIREGDQPPPKGVWDFPAPFGEQPTVGEFSTVDVVTLSRHIEARTISTWINTAPLADLSNPGDGPEAIDETGRSAQQFAIEAVVQSGSKKRWARASGQDIYAITAPIIVEAMSWILAGKANSAGALAAGQLFDARTFLETLSPYGLRVKIGLKSSPPTSH